MKLFDFSSKPKVDRAELQARYDNGHAIELMLKSEGWIILDALLREQLEAYIHDNALSAKDWENYLDKRAKIHAIRLLFTDIEDFVLQGQEAEEALEKLKD